MDWFIYLVVFTGCFVITSGIHILMMNRIEKCASKHFKHGDEGYKDLEKISTLGMMTLMILFVLTLGLCGFTMFALKTM